jgi:hypothetical protein
MKLQVQDDTVPNPNYEHDTGKSGVLRLSHLRFAQSNRKKIVISRHDIVTV